MGHRRVIGFGAVGLTLGAVSVCAEDEGSENMRPTVILPTITVEAPRPAFDPALEISAITVLDREMLARSEERDLNGVFRGLPSVTLQTPGSRGTLSTLFVRGSGSGLGQLTFDGVPLYSSVNGGFNLSTFPADALERIEVVRGASGPRYGSGPSGASSGSRAAMLGNTAASCISRAAATAPCRRRSAGH